MNDADSITVTPVHVGDLVAEGELMPVMVHVIDHPAGRVLVDTGLTELHEAVADMDPRLFPLDRQDFDLAGIDMSSIPICISTTAAGTTFSLASRSTSSAGSLTTRATRTTTPFASGSTRPVWSTRRSTASSSSYPGFGSSRRPATHAARRWW